MTPELSRLIQVVWELAALAFLAGVVFTVRKARARGKRLFVDEPTARVRALHHSTVDHTQDAL